MVFKKNVEGVVTKKLNAKVVVFTCPVDVTTTETTVMNEKKIIYLLIFDIQWFIFIFLFIFKGTVLIKTADELMNFSRGEENRLEEQIKSLKNIGVDVVVSGGKFGDLALHYLNKYDMMAVRLQSKFDIRRLSKTVNATALPKLVTFLYHVCAF